jgi:CubicO group peptidase (beta-lactamase class C family)
MPPKEDRRSERAWAGRGGDGWTVVISDMFIPTADRRRGQIGVIFDRLWMKGYVSETFAGRKANRLDAARVEALTAFIERGRKLLDVPGVALGLVQDGKVVFAGGFGVRELGKPAKVDADTLFMVASTTKAMTTLMLGKLVESGRLTWDTPVTAVLPTFKLGDPDTTRSVLVKHLVCACTGMPRQDLESIFEFRSLTPAALMARLATMQPTTKFGELFQYSNPLAAAGGFVGGHVAYPRLELGAAYDRAMQTRVFGPLGMTATTFDTARAMRANHAAPHARSYDDVTEVAGPGFNPSTIATRPAAGAWSSVRDMLKYVAMEASGGVLPGGRRYVSEDVLRARRAPQVAVSRDTTYGMGLAVGSRYGTPVVSHDGSLIGYKSGFVWLPEHRVGAVVLTNADTGGVLVDAFRRKLLEVLFDGRPHADALLAARSEAMHAHIAADRKLLGIPAATDEAAKLAGAYHNDALGDVDVIRKGGTVVFDFGEWRSEVATRKDSDGKITFMTIVPGVDGFEFIAGAAGGTRTLTLRDAQHEYLFTER